MTHNTVQLLFFLCSACITENCGHNLTDRIHYLQSPFALKNLLFWLFVCLWSVVVYLCFISSYVVMQKQSGLRQKSAKTGSEPNIRLRLFPTESKRGTYLVFSHSIVHAKLKTLYLVICLWSRLFHVLSFVDHFGSSHSQWTSRRMFSFCWCTAMFKLVYPIINSCKHRDRCAMNCI